MRDKFKQLKDNNYYYNPKLKHRAATLRNAFTEAEVYLWENVLMAYKVAGFRFMRQVPVLYYVPDFMCKELALIIEVDGKIHDFQKNRDIQRQYRLEGCGFTVLRFTNEEVLTDIEDVRFRILTWVEKNRPTK